MIQVTVNIDEKMFDESIGGALKSLKPEEMSEMLTNCIKEYLLGKNSKGENNIEKIIYDEETSYFGGSRTLKPSYFTKAMLEKLDYSALQEVVDKCINELKENHKDILEEVMLEMIVQGLKSTYNFNEILNDTVKNIIRTMNSN